MHVNSKWQPRTTTRALTFSVVVACLLVLAESVFAHHGTFYKAAFHGIKNADLDQIKDLFTESAWAGKCGALAAAELQQRLKNGKVALLAENSSRDAKRSRCIVMLKLQYPERADAVERIWLLAERADEDKHQNSNRRRDAWKVVRIVNDEKQAQSFFKHSYPLGW